MTQILSKDEIIEIVEDHSVQKDEIAEAVSDGIKQAFVQIGIAAEGASDIVEMQQDMAYIRKLRTGSDTIKSKVFLTVVGAAVTAVIALFTAGFMTMFGGNPS